MDRTDPTGTITIHRDDKFNRRQADKAAAKLAKLRQDRIADQRRGKVMEIPTGSYTTETAERLSGTVFTSTVFDPDPSETVLKPGKNNSKLGGRVLVGRLAGAPIYSLTLEERRTCPASCEHWRGCYGNGMQRAKRYRHGPQLTRKIEAELSDLMADGGPILIRLHVLGDFWSVAYVDFWRRQLDRHAGLHVFGFTAWPPTTQIGARLVALRSDFPDRWAMRESGRTGEWGSFTLPFWTTEKKIGDAVVCPAQIDGLNGSPQARHCGNCAACWSTDRPIAFMRH